MTNKFLNKRITYVWVELEMHSNWYSWESIGHKLWLSKYKFNKHWIKYSLEYYPETFELNFKPFNINNIKAIQKYKHYAGEVKSKYSLSLFNRWPAFVWTHIHIFNPLLFNNRSEILKITMAFILDNIKFLSKNDILRLLLAHQLWAYHDKLNNDVWRNFIINSWLPASSVWRDKRKYQPILFSRENIDTGKPKSIEIRIVPNTFFFNGLMEKLVLTVLDKVNNKNIPEIDENIFFNTLYNAYNKLRG